MYNPVECPYNSNSDAYYRKNNGILKKSVRQGWADLKIEWSIPVPLTCMEFAVKIILSFFSWNVSKIR